MKVLIGLQARTKSTRLPGKIYQKIGEKSILEWVYQACHEAHRRLNAKNISSVVAVLGPKDDEELQKFCTLHDMKLYQPTVDENDLILRYRAAMKPFDATHVVRITSDCWQTNPELIVEGVEILKKMDYVSNTVQRTFLEGLDFQMCSEAALKWFDQNQIENREHPFYEFDMNSRERIRFQKEGLTWMSIMNPRAEWVIRTSIDDQDDLDRARLLYERKQNEESKKSGLILAGTK